MRRTELDEELILKGLSIHDLCSRMREEIDTYVSHFQLDGMYDICTITGQPTKKYYWFVRENGTFLWDQAEAGTGENIRRATDLFKKRRIYFIERTSEGYTIELMTNTYNKED